MGMAAEVEIEDICETDWVKNFEFHDAEAFRLDIYKSFGVSSASTTSKWLLFYTKFKT